MTWLGTAFLSILLTSEGRAAQCEGLEPQLVKATSRLDEGSLDEAKAIFLQLQRSHPECNRVLLGLGRIALAQGNSSAAARFFIRYKETAPSDPLGYYHLGELFLSLAKGRAKKEYFPKADLMSELAVRFGPDFPPALVLRANVLLAKGQLLEAQNLVQQVCRMSPQNINARFLLGMTLYKQKRYHEAKAQFENIIAINPMNAWAYDYLALNLEYLGENQKARQAYQTGLAVNRGEFFDTLLQFNYGSFLLRQNELSEAKLHLDRALEFMPDKRAGYYERARVNLRLKNYQEAQADLAKSLQFRPPDEGSIKDHQIYYLLSRVHGQLGQVELARKYAGMTRRASANSDSSGPEPEAPPEQE